MSGISERVERAILNGRADAASADNADATVTLAATPNASQEGTTNIPMALQYSLLGVQASFSGAVAAVRTVVVNYTDPDGTARSITFRWDFTAGDFILPFPCPLVVRAGAQATATLAASGAGGNVGTVTLWYTLI